MHAQLALGYCVIICLPRIHSEPDAAITAATGDYCLSRVNSERSDGGGRMGYTITFHYITPLITKKKDRTDVICELSFLCLPFCVTAIALKRHQLNKNKLLERNVSQSKHAQLFQE